MWKSYCPLRVPAGTNKLDSYSQPLNEERLAAAHAPADGPLLGLPGPSQPQLQPLQGPAAGCAQSRPWHARAAQQSAADGPSTAELLRRRRRQRQLALWKAGSPLPAVQLVSGAGHCAGTLPHVIELVAAWRKRDCVMPHEAVGFKAGSPGIMQGSVLMVTACMTAQSVEDVRCRQARQSKKLRCLKPGTVPHNGSMHAFAR